MFYYFYFSWLLTTFPPTVHFIPITLLLCNWKFVPLNLSHLFLSFPHPFFSLFGLLCFLAQNTSQAHILLSLPWNHSFLQFLQMFLPSPHLPPPPCSCRLVSVIEPMLPAVERWSLVHWTAREFPRGIVFRNQELGVRYVRCYESIIASKIFQLTEKKSWTLKKHIDFKNSNTNSNSTNTTRFLSFYICILFLTWSESWFSIKSIYLCICSVL